MNSPATSAALQPRRLSIGRGWDWIAEGFQLFGRAPGTWVLIGIIYFVTVLVSAFIPGASLIFSLFSYVFTGGLMLGCFALDSGQELRLEHLFAGFKSPHFTNLLLLALIYLGLFFLTAFVFGIVAAVTVGLSFHGMPDPNKITPEQILPVILICLLLVAALIPVMMGVWLAPPLIALRGLGPIEAFKQSFRACWINFLPLLWYGLLAFLLLLLAMLPLLLGLLLILPVMYCSLYAAYRDIYPAPQPPPLSEVPPPLL